ncbi:MAG: helix-turn-helix transcriptional regulator [Rhizobiaceae bacterium]|nr:helix-turn-helix transcriptional regulator [Rhizobiaceae bacterium]
MVSFNTDATRVDRTFFALSNRTRRSMTEMLLREGEKPMRELAKPFGISLPGAMKHIGVLEDAGIVLCRRQGRENLCSVNPSALKDAAGWFEFHARFWSESFERLGRMLAERKS